MWQSLLKQARTLLSSGLDARHRPERVTGDADSLDAVRAMAEAGDAEAQSTLGRMIMTAGGANARQEAESWFQRAAAQGLAKAKHNLGVLYFHDDNTSPIAMQWFTAAAQDGWQESIFVLGAAAEEKGNTERARSLFQHAAERGNALAQDALSRLLFEGKTDDDHKASRDWAELAAAQGIAAANTRLGFIFHEGLGTDQDPSRAASCFLRAAKQGHAGAQAMIGGLLRFGIGVAPDPIEAAHWLMRSADQSNEMGRIGLWDITRSLQPHEVDEAKRRSQGPIPK